MQPVSPESRKSVDLVRRLFEALKRNDVASALDCLDPEVLWYGKPRGGFGGRRPLYRGHTGFKEFAAAVWEQAWPEAEEFVDADNGQVVCTYRLGARVPRRGAPLRSLMMYDLYTVHRQRIVERRPYAARDEALKAAAPGRSLVR
jgi:ketosteroid isomerase-like protein